jgi:hypothetical protein
MKQTDLPQRWQERLQKYLLEIGSKYNSLSAEAFIYDLRIEFGDGSNALFCYAFYWTDKELNEFIVFTEHCGYHIFPLFDTKIETFGRDGNSIKFEDFTFE